MTRPPGVLPGSLSQLHPDSWTSPFWKAAAQHRLVLPRCGSCATFRMPPTPFCHRCRSQAVVWVDHPGRGIVYSFTIVHHPVAPELAEHVPYVIALVDFPDAPGARLVVNILGGVSHEIEIGMEVAIVWDDVDLNVTIPRAARLPR